MLNVFPDLLAFGLLAPVLLRLAVGALFVKAGVKKLRGASWITARFEKMGLASASYVTIAFGILEVVSGLMLIAGFYTQIAALVTAVISAFCWHAKKNHPEHVPGSNGAFMLMFLISLSLLFSGAGFFAFDLPL